MNNKKEKDIMINDEFLIKIEKIIEYLKLNGGYNYKLYNRLCPNYTDIPDSNIVEYAIDIRDYWKKLKYNDDLETYIKMEICEIVMDNLKLFMWDDTKLKKLREYCKVHVEEPITPTPNEILIEFVQEALQDLLISNLYDFRDL